MYSPLVSVIIPTYNSALTLSECLNSILNQKLRNIEVLVIDGASSDGTVDLLNEFSQTDDRVKWVSQMDKGIYDAMNKGVLLAKGEWIYFLGSDDTLVDCDVLECLSKHFTKEIDVIYGNVISTRFNGRYDGEFSISKIYSQNICHQSIFFKKVIFKEIGLFNLKYPAHADWDHNIKWLINKKIRSKYLPIDIANYADGGFSSIHGDSIFAKDKKFNFLKNSLYAPKNDFVLSFSKQILREINLIDNWKTAILSFIVIFKQKILLKEKLKK